MNDIYDAIKFKEEKNLTSLLKTYTDLTDKQIKDILNIRKEDGTVSLKIDSEENDDLGFVYEIIAMVKQYGFDKTYNFVKNNSNKITDRQILESDEFEEQKKKYNDDTIKLRNKVKVKSTGIFTCPRCNEKDTSYTEVQLRSGDEGSTFIIACNACGYQFKRNS
jgi:DNA-directed RNA polymerase subunit M/transcription elongation factor TFIIS